MSSVLLMHSLCTGLESSLFVSSVFEWAGKCLKDGVYVIWPGSNTWTLGAFHELVLFLSVAQVFWSL